MENMYPKILLWAKEQPYIGELTDNEYEYKRPQSIKLGLHVWIIKYLEILPNIFERIGREYIHYVALDLRAFNECMFKLGIVNIRLNLIEQIDSTAGYGCSIM